jgi:mono/diheme cytochrome c family protein
VIDTASTYGDAETLMDAEVATSNLRYKIPTPRRPRPSLACLEADARTGKMNSKLIKALIVGAITAGAATIAHAQQNGPAEQTFDAGKDYYDSHCAACHGLSGAGEGPYARFLKATIPNLTTLSKRNGGVFPYSQVYKTIDGRLALPAHGTRDMPIWGQEFSYKKRPLNPDPEAFVRAKINALVLYIHRLQAK